jgi:hypothetical protein
MPDNDFAGRVLPHVAIDLFRDPGQYRFPNRPQNREPKREDYHAHAEALLQQLTAALGALPAPGADPRVPIAGLKSGTIVEIETLAPDGDRVKAAKIPAIEFPGQDIVVLRSQRNDDRTESAILFVPDDARGFLRDKIERYGDDMPGERADRVTAANHPKRLLLIATGNAEPAQRDVIETFKSLEDPAQSWNALTVGGYTAKEAIPVDPPGLTPIVPANHRSPFSRGSCDLPDDLTPIKPEVLFEAGNMLVDATGYCGVHPAVSLLAAGSDVEREPLIPFNATSAAAGVAGNFLGRMKAGIPGYWPETYRALTVNAADWPQPIRSRLIGRGAHWKSISKGKRQKILREVGYGVPDLDRALLSAANDVTMIAQAEIQPFASVNGQPPVFNEMHFYDLPWPRAILQGLENEIVTLKVTLSYFVEPNLSGRAATRPDTYRSFGLRFEMKKRTETGAAFRRRMTARRDADEQPANETSHWLLGPNAVQAGSLHCDLWRGAAVDLASHDAIAIYPVGGWWKSHVGQRRMNDTARYALVISLSAPGLDIDLHADIAAKVEAKALEVAAALIEAAPGRR